MGGGPNPRRGSKSASGYGPGGSKSASGFGPGGPNPRGVQIRCDTGSCTWKSGVSEVILSLSNLSSPDDAAKSIFETCCPLSLSLRRLAAHSRAASRSRCCCSRSDCLAWSRSFALSALAAAACKSGSFE